MSSERIFYLLILKQYYKKHSCNHTFLLAKEYKQLKTNMPKKELKIKIIHFQPSELLNLPNCCSTQ